MHRLRMDSFGSLEGTDLSFDGVGVFVFLYFLLIITIVTIV